MTTANYDINKRRPDIALKELGKREHATYYTKAQIAKWLDRIRGDISTKEWELLERIRDE